MKKILLAGVATVALAAAAPANAADLRMPVKAAPIAAPAPYFSWTGCYIGVHTGWGWGRKEWRTTNSDSSLEFDPVDVDASGPVFGGQLGCNYQFQPNWVIGIEGSLAGTDINGFQIEGDQEEARVKTDSIASITGRLGFAGWIPSTLWYIKGGVAWAHDRYLFTNTRDDTWQASESRTGWTIGLGVEWAFAQNWSAKVEWNHYDFGDSTVGFHSGCCDIGNEIIKQRIETVTVGLNYRFDTALFGIGKAPFGKGPVTARY